MAWIDDYKRKLVTADEALKCIKSGNRIAIHPGCAEPETLVRAMIKRKDELFDVELVHLLTFGIADYVLPGMEGHFRHNALFAGKNVRKEINEGRADWIPIFLHEISGLYDEVLPLDATLLNLSPPDEHGFCSFGVGVDVTKRATALAKINIAQINPRMPRTLGDSFIHVNRLDYIVEVDEALPEQPRVELTELHKQIGRHIANIIEDGSTLQMGIGGIPDGVLSYLHDKKDLGVHTEMFSDNMVELVEKGVINGAKKTIHNGKVVASFLLGTRPLFNYVHNNPVIELHPTEYVNDPFVIAQNAKMVALNSALQIDITGQVCSDSIGTSIYSGFGGQVDFIRGAAHSKGGKPVIAVPSTAKEGKLSRIVPFLDQGAGVVTTRADVHWVATEYGLVNLHGKNLRQRAELLISISHPKFREMLERAAFDRKLFTKKVF
jgi:4-hydroxybutyrate CoA-transferase